MLSIAADNLRPVPDNNQVVRKLALDPANNPIVPKLAIGLANDNLVRKRSGIRMRKVAIGRGSSQVAGRRATEVEPVAHKGDRRRTTSTVS